MNDRKKSLLLSAMSAAVAIMLLGYAAYGWMSMSKDVRARGNNVKVVATDGLEISLDRDTGYSDSVTVNLKAIVEELTAADAYQYDADSMNFYLLPASSLNGVGDFWATDKSNYDGSAPTGTVFEQGHRVMKTDRHGDFEGHYIDVKLWLRNLAGIVDGYIGLNEEETNIVPDAVGQGIENVVRVAFLSEDASAVSLGTDPLVFAGGVPMTPAVITGATTSAVPEYMTFDANGVSDQGIVNLEHADYEAGEVYAKCVTLRIWIEGQDRSCVARIGGMSFNLNIGFIAKNI